MQELDGDQRADAGMARQVDRAHAAAPEQTHDSIRADRVADQLVEWTFAVAWMKRESAGHGPE